MLDFDESLSILIFVIMLESETTPLRGHKTTFRVDITFQNTDNLCNYLCFVYIICFYYPLPFLQKRNKKEQFYFKKKSKTRI